MTHAIYKDAEWYLEVAKKWHLTVTDANPRNDDYYSKLLRKTTRMLKEATGWAWHSCSEPEDDNSHSHKCTGCGHEFVHSLSSLACEACHTCSQCGTAKNWDIHQHIKHRPDPLRELLRELAGWR